MARHNLATNLAAKQELERLMKINRIQLEILRELRSVDGKYVRPEPAAVAD